MHGKKFWLYARCFEHLPLRGMWLVVNSVSHMLTRTVMQQGDSSNELM
jgi:Mg/Co/Ni transporter MgtE